MTKKIDELKAALGEVQSQLAFQEDTIHTLHELALKQQSDIEQLNLRLEQLKTLFEESQNQAGIRNFDERPPHY